jgi:hypothetical protein
MRTPQRHAITPAEEATLTDYGSAQRGKPWTSLTPGGSPSSSWISLADHAGRWGLGRLRRMSGSARSGRRASPFQPHSPC